MINIIILCIASMLNYISKEMVYPILPLYLTATLGITPAIVGLMEGISKSLASIIKFYSGYFSDKKNRRKGFIIIGFFWSLLHKFFLFFSNGWLWVLFAKIVERFGKAIYIAPKDAMIGESGLKNGRAFGLQRTFDKLGAVIGIVISYLLVTKYFEINYRKVFLLSIIPVGIGIFLLSFLKSSEDRKKRDIDFKRFDKKIKFFFVIVFISSLGNSSKSFLLLKAADNGFSSPNIIILYLIANIVTCFCAYPIGKICDKVSKKNIIFISYLLFSLIYSILGITQNHFITILLFILYGLYISLISVSAKTFIVSNVPNDMIATSLGINECLIGLSSLPATIIAGSLWSFFGPNAPFYFSSVIALIAALLVIIYIRE